MERFHFFNGSLILEREVRPNGELLVERGRIRTIGRAREFTHLGDSKPIDLQGGYLSPGFVELHVHGGAGSDFMDLTEEAFRTICSCHARHGTTSLTPTTTVGSVEGHLRFLELCGRLMNSPPTGARVLGAHLYGPYFNPEAKGCHPGQHIASPSDVDTDRLLEFAKCISSATVAPELPNAEGFVRRFRAAGIHCNVGHSYATFEEMERAIGWGVRHVDHLFCAMSDRARLRQTQTYPMRGGVMEATLYFDELTTEVIADGKHLQGELLRLAYKIKGPDRLALVTDANRAVDMPDGEYWFGPTLTGERILRTDEVGLMPDGKSLASGVMGMDHLVRTMWQQTQGPLHEIIRMASLTSARIIGWDQQIGSLQEGKRADLLVLDRELNVNRVFVDGVEVI